MVLALCLAHSVAAQIPLDRQAPPPPLVTSPQWQTWYATLLAQRLAECPRARATASGDVALLFRRGDIWRESLGLETTQKDMTIADYGDANLPKPVFTAFASVGLASLWEPVAGTPGLWRRPSGGLVTWVRQSEDLNVVLSRQSTLAGCGATIGSWYSDEQGGWLYVRPLREAGFDIDPRVSAAQFSLARITLSGVVVRGDGSRVENIVAVGWGMNTYTPNPFPSQQHGINSWVVDGNRAVISGCESFYGSSHAMVHAASGAGGGITTFINCKAGYCQYNGGPGETVFNTFAYLGGSETIFDSCVAVAGTLPSSEWNSATERRTVAFFGHAGGLVNGTLRTLSLVVSNNCSSLSGPYQCSNPSNFGDVPAATILADVRCFIVGEFNAGGPRSGWLAPCNASTVRINCRYLNQVMDNSQILVSYRQAGWLINSQLELTIPARGGYVSMFLSRANQPCPVKLINNHLRFITTSPATDFCFDLFEPNFSAGSLMVNNIITRTGPGAAHVNLGAIGDEIRGNAFVGFYFTATNALDNYIRGQPNIVLTAEPPLGGVPPCDSPLRYAAQPTAAGVALILDANGTISHYGYRSTIGPIEGIRCVVDDLYKFAIQPADLNADGVINEADKGLMERAVRWRESPPNAAVRE